MKKLKYLFLLLSLSIILSGCQGGLHPIKFFKGKYGKSSPPAQIVYTNSVILIKDTSPNVQVIPNYTNRWVDKIEIVIRQEPTTNTINIGGTVQRQKTFTLQSLFVYYFLLIFAVLVGIYMWKTKKSPSLKMALKKAEASAITSTIIPTATTTGLSSETPTVVSSISPTSSTISPKVIAPKDTTSDVKSTD